MPPLVAVWSSEHWDGFLMALLAAAAFGLLGIVLMLAGFKLFEWLTPKLDVEAELAKGNRAVGTTVGALLLAIALIMLAAIHG